MDSFRFHAGDTPLLVSMPHVGTHVPANIASRLSPAAQPVPDTDWHVDRLYDFLGALGASTITATQSRYVIDLNRAPDDTPLYPGASNTGLCPTTTFDESAIYRDSAEPDSDEIAAQQPELEAIRQHCKRLPEEFPPLGPDEYCGPAGLEILRNYVKPLQAGAFSQFIEDLRNPQPKLATKVASSAPAAGATRAESKPKRLLSTSKWFLKWLLSTIKWLLSTIKQVLSKTTRFLKWAGKKRAERKQVKHVKTAARQAAKAADQRAAAVRAARIPGAAPAKGARAPRGKAAKRAPAPSAKAVKRKAKGKLTEAGAIQLLLQRGMTAAQFDDQQQQMFRQRGEQPTPAEVVRALLNRPKQSKAAARKKERALKRQALRQERRRRRSPLAVPALLLLVLLPCMPLAAWRIPDGDPVTIEGDVRHELLNPASDPLDLLRTPFESLWGNKPVDLANGTRLYLTKEDYERCRPQSANAYTLHLTAEARPLLFGGYEVITLKKTEKTDQPLIITK